MCKQILKTEVKYPGIDDMVSEGVPEAKGPNFGVIIRPV